MDTGVILHGLLNSSRSQCPHKYKNSYTVYLVIRCLHIENIWKVSFCIFYFWYLYIKILLVLPGAGMWAPGQSRRSDGCHGDLLMYKSQINVIVCVFSAVTIHQRIWSHVNVSLVISINLEVLLSFLANLFVVKTITFCRRNEQLRRLVGICFYLIWSYVNNLYSLEVVNRGSEPKLQMGKNLNSIAWHAKC